MPNAGSGCDGSSGHSNGLGSDGWSDEQTLILQDHELDVLMLDARSRAQALGVASTPGRRSDTANGTGAWSYSAARDVIVRQRHWIGLVIALPLLVALGWATHTAFVPPMVGASVAASPLAATATSALRARGDNAMRMRGMHHAASAEPQADARGADREPGVETGFTIDSEPTGATVDVDGIRIAQVTPVRITDLAAGPHNIRLSAGEAFGEWTTQFALARGQIIFLPTIQLAPTQAEKPRAPARRAHGALTIHSVPWAMVEVDGKPLGSTPQYKLPLRAGNHRVLLTHEPLGLSKAITVRIAPGKTTIRSIDLNAL